MKLNRKQLRKLILNEISMGVRGPTGGTQYIQSDGEDSVGARLKYALKAAKRPMYIPELAKFLKVSVAEIDNFLSKSPDGFEQGGWRDAVGLPEHWPEGTEKF